MTNEQNETMAQLCRAIEEACAYGNKSHLKRNKAAELRIATALSNATGHPVKTISEALESIF